MKSFLKIIIPVIMFLVFLAVVAVIYIDKTEWSVRDRYYEVSISVETDEQTISEIEKAVRKEVLKYCPESYLGEIVFSTASGDRLENLNEGSIKFSYCKNIGDFFGYYGYDRFVFCDAYVDLNKSEITQINTYGNSRTDGLEEILDYPENKEVLEIMDDYVLLMESDGQPYAITKFYSDTLSAHTYVKMNVILTKNEAKEIEGYIQDYNGTYKFLKN